MKKMKESKLYLCDYGYGIWRYDIGRICITEHHSKDGDYEGNSWACEFDFKLLEFTRRLKEFLSNGKVKV